MKTFTIIVMPWEKELFIVAADEKTARKIAWLGLSGAEQDNCECLDVVEVS